jgi:putative integral membrane protein (TIGR02587 family)
MSSHASAGQVVTNRDFVRGLARAAAGALLFALPLLMTMEMWWLGFYIDRARLLLFMLLNLAVLVPLSHIVGFERTSSWIEDIVDAFIAYGVAIVVSAAILALIAVITPSMPPDEIIGKIAIQAVPASIGAALARGQFAKRGDGEDGDGLDVEQTYAVELFLMLIGAVFIAFNLAPTEEMIAIAFKMSPWHALAMIAVSIVVLHAFVYALDFRGEEELPQGMSGLTGLLVFTVAGYGISLLVSLYVLWTFGRTDGAPASEIAMMVTVLGFPAALGAGTARLIV